MGLVLIAEDEEAMLEVFGDVVEELGHRTVRAQDGESERESESESERSHT